VTTVLQSVVFDLSTGGLSHNPVIVITGVLGLTVAALAGAAPKAVAASGGAGGAAGFAACPQATVATKNRHIHPLHVVKSGFLRS
jgi:hypothetical protein